MVNVMNSPMTGSGKWLVSYRNPKKTIKFEDILCRFVDVVLVDIVAVLDLVYM